MITVLLCSSDSQERQILARDCRMRVADGCGDEMQILNAVSEEEFLQILSQEQVVHLLYYDFHRGQPISGLRQFRRQSTDAMIMLITDETVSPLEYLRPGIAPDALLLRPIQGEKLDLVNREFVDSFLERLRKGDSRDSFLVSTREEKIFIPYSMIYYFEARDKRLYVRTRDHEYPFYGTIDALEKQLPIQFRRCHRSYLVNTEKIRRVDVVDSCLDLGSHIGVPVSRSYRSAFKGDMKWNKEI